MLPLERCKSHRRRVKWLQVRKIDLQTSEARSSVSFDAPAKIKPDVHSARKMLWDGKIFISLSSLYKNPPPPDGPVTPKFTLLCSPYFSLLSEANSLIRPTQGEDLVSLVRRVHDTATVSLHLRTYLPVDYKQRMTSLWESQPKDRGTSPDQVAQPPQSHNPLRGTNLSDTSRCMTIS